MSNAYVDPWDMMNNFCFHVYAQVFVIMSHIYIYIQPEVKPLPELPGFNPGATGSQ